MRKLGESIIINDTIEVKVIEVKGKSVKLGFDFPDDATVLRKEIHDRIIAENIAAASQEFDIADIVGNTDLSTLSLPSKDDKDA